MKKLILIPMFILIGATAGFAQGFTKFECSVATLNFDSPNPEVIGKQPVKEIGRFKVDGVGGRKNQQVFPSPEDEVVCGRHPLCHR